MKYIKFFVIFIAFLSSILLASYVYDQATKETPIVQVVKSDAVEIYGFHAIDLKNVDLITAYGSEASRTLVIQNKDGKKQIFKNIQGSIFFTYMRDVLMNKEIKFDIKPLTDLPKQYVDVKPVIKKSYFDAVKSIYLDVFFWLLDKSFAIITIIIMIYFIVISVKGFSTKSTEIILPEDITGSMDDLIGMKDIKDEVNAIVKLIENRDKYKEFGIDKPFNIMFTGPAGTGKSKLAGYFAKQLNFPLITIAGSNLETGLVGGGSKTIRNIYEKAKELGKCVIFLDEAQSLFMQRGASVMSSKHSDDTANTLLSILDGVSTEADSNIVWVVASNFDEDKIKMDEAMLRRFQLKVNFRLPNKAERKAILESLLLKDEYKKLLDDKLDLTNCSEMMAELSPAILQTIVQQAKMNAIDTNSLIDNNAMFKAFERTVIGLTDRETTAEMNKTRKIVAIHELGHFFVKLHNTLLNEKTFEDVKEKITTLKISTEAVSKMNALGYVLSKQEEDKLTSLSDLEDHIKSLYGGVAAEETLLGKMKITQGSHNDIEKVSVLLNNMILELSMYSESKVNYRKLNLTDTKEDIKKIDEKAKELYNETLSIINLYKPLIEEMYQVLLDRYVISKDEMFEILEGNQTFKELLIGRYNM